MQYKVEGGQFANAVNVSGNWSQFRITLPLPPTTPGQPTTRSRFARSITFGTTGEISKPFAVQPQPPIVVPPGSEDDALRRADHLVDHELDAPRAAVHRCRHRHQLERARVRSAVDADAPVADGRVPGGGRGHADPGARARDDAPRSRRRFSGELPQADGRRRRRRLPRTAYDPTRTPLEVLVERRRMRAADANDARMLTFAVEAGLHFLRMLELQALSKSYRAAFITRLALQPLAPPAPRSSTTRRRGTCSRWSAARPTDGSSPPRCARAGAAQLVLDPALNIAVADRPKVQQAATAWLAWYDSMYSEPGRSGRRCVESVAARVCAVGRRAPVGRTPQDEMTLSATEIDGPIDWSSFDVNTPGVADDGRRSERSRRSSRPRFRRR